ncbi:MAG: RNA methyltransferase [Magnetococcales bacterium]|nr:RNA methyltransferase [Magnetococcales bacterium]
MPITPIDEPDDLRVLPYHALRGDGLEEDAGFFLCAGITLVERLLASRVEVDSLLVTRRRVERIPRGVPERVPVYVIPDALLPLVAGRGYKNGVYARARRPFLRTGGQLVTPTAPRRMTLMVLPRLTMPGNVGAVVRSAAALGADGLIVGPECAELFHHQAVRASMGALFVLPVARSPDLAGDLLRLKREMGFRLAAAVLTPDAQPLDRFVPPEGAGERYALLLGNEFDGLDPSLAALCDHRLIMPMANGVDSLNVAMAATVFLYHFLRFHPPGVANVRIDPP